MQEGWLCPRCKKINAPWVSQCPCFETTSRINHYSDSTETAVIPEDFWRETTTTTTQKAQDYITTANT